MSKVWWLGQVRVSWTFPQSHILQQWHCHSPNQSIAYHLCRESGIPIKRGAVDIHFSHTSAIDGPSLSITPGAYIVWVGNHSLNHATAPPVVPQHALWSLDGVVAGSTTADSTGILAKFLENIMANMRDQEVGLLLHVDMESCTFHASLPHLTLRVTLLLSVHDEHQVISIEKLPWYNGVELTRQRLQYQDEGQWAKAKPWCTPTPMPNSSLYWPWTHTWLRASEYMPWVIHTAHSSTPRLRKAHHRTFLGTWSKAFLRLMKAKWISLFSAMYFYYSWRTTKMVSVVPLTGTKPNCISSMFTISWMLEFSVHSTSLMAWSMSLIDAKIVALVEGCTLAHIEVWN